MQVGTRWNDGSSLERKWEALDKIYKITTAAQNSKIQQNFLSNFAFPPLFFHEISQNFAIFPLKFAEISSELCVFKNIDW